MEDLSCYKRNASFQILFALFFAFLMIALAALFKDEPWSNDIAPWMAIIYVLLNGVFVAQSVRKTGTDEH